MPDQPVSFNHGKHLRGGYHFMPALQIGHTDVKKLTVTHLHVSKEQNQAKNPKR